eukprot:6054306-Pyramimonas_sp.AAC.1
MGWPMGGCLSEVGTLADLGEDVHNLYTRPSRAQKINLDIPGYSVDDILQGVIYVDDSLVLSRVYCSSCLHKHMRKLWPKDTGVSCEAKDLPLTYLQASIIPQGMGFEVVPFSINSDYA